MYSQHDEDDLIAKYVPAVGRFLDIGAYRPKELSNTRLLYERGWSGVCIEPSPEGMNHLIDAYGYDERVVLIQALIGPADRLALLEVTDGPVSTTDATVRRTWAKDGNYRGRVWVPQRTVEQINSQFGPFDFINIDAEGSSPAIFGRIMGANIRPACLCVEHDGAIIGLERIAKRHGYETAGSNETNLVFYR